MAAMAKRSEHSSQVRFAAYVEALTGVIGHADRAAPLRAYCTGLLMPAERKSVEPIAAVTAPARVAAQHQSLLHFVANAPWSDAALLRRVREIVLPDITRHEPVAAWIVDDTSFPKKGRHSVGVARQYCGQLGKQDNCQVAVTLALATHAASLPVSYRLYLPQDWAEDAVRRQKAGVPEEVAFQTKPEIALDQIGAALEAGLARAPVLLDAGYGNDTGLRTALSALGLSYVAGILSSTSVWAHGTAPLPPRRGRAAAGGRSGCAAMRSTSRSRSGRWRSGCRQRPGPRSPGARA
jgi:SRSO17 transposase